MDCNELVMDLYRSLVERDPDVVVMCVDVTIEAGVFCLVKKEGVVRGPSIRPIEARARVQVRARSRPGHVYTAAAPGTVVGDWVVESAKTEEDRTTYHRPPIKDDTVMKMRWRREEPRVES